MVLWTSLSYTVVNKKEGRNHCLGLVILSSHSQPCLHSNAITLPSEAKVCTSNTLLVVNASLFDLVGSILACLLK
jgi:hypothetical protein